jgi:hypothetical protein
MEFTSIIYALFQGDDIVLCVDSYKIVHDYSFFKFQEVEIATFIGFLVWKDRLLLDIPRMAAKLMNRSIVDNKALEEYKLAVGDWLTVIESFDDYYDNLHLAADRYGVSFGDLSTLLSLLVAFTCGGIVDKILGANNKPLRGPYNFYEVNRVIV